MLSNLITMLRDGEITVDSINIHISNFSYSVKVTYIENDTQRLVTADINCRHYMQACKARNKLESLAVLY